ncbi:hypothetical protein [Neorhizobium sp. NCHU2750]|uniref:SDH family Clp fold serine proteinase n=1 Tax=Neorhizobium sp. NCHU2750 TaxID=1825976 RepID=UPI000EB64147|nr:hypothetical protein NCHU2750_33230 [Neorhizobium sp. NCHU2750]
MGDRAELKKIIEAVENFYDADIYAYSAPIDHEGFGRIVKSFRKRRPNAILILTTSGGLANSAYKIARFFQEQYEEFFICLPSVCKSAGTLLAIGAHKLIMGPFSELGPLDVQLYERDEIFSRKSGLLSHSAFDALKQEAFSLYEHFLLSIKARSGDNISFPVASSVAGDLAGHLMAPIFEQISPNVLGSDFRDLQVAIHYGSRLAQYSENISDANIQLLTENYPSHDFIIDTQEASELFSNVEAPDETLWKLIGTIAQFVLSESESGIVNRLSSLTDPKATEEQDNEDEEDIFEDKDHAGNMGSGADPDREGHNRKGSQGTHTPESHGPSETDDEAGGETTTA